MITDPLELYDLRGETIGTVCKECLSCGVWRTIPEQYKVCRTCYIEHLAGERN